MKKCVYCLSDIEEISLASFLEKKYQLCIKCISKLESVKKRVKIDSINLYGLYKYNDFASSLLIQYKECMDEVLSIVLADLIKRNINPIYLCKTWLIAPSSNRKIEERGFNHLVKICELLNVKWIDCFEKIDENDQKKLSKEKRSKIKNSIKLKEGIVLPKNYVLFDDLCTTGSTLIGMKNALGNKQCNSIVLFMHPLLIKEKKLVFCLERSLIYRK